MGMLEPGFRRYGEGRKEYWGADATCHTRAECVPHQSLRRLGGSWEAMGGWEAAGKASGRQLSSRLPLLGGLCTLYRGWFFRFPSDGFND